MKQSADLREVLLKTVHQHQEKALAGGGALIQSAVLDAVSRELGISHSPDQHLAVLTLWNDLFRTGYLGWGLNLNNPDPPFFHVTDRGRQVLERLSRDPGNPAGYRRHVADTSKLNAVAESYLMEGLECFTAGLHKAAAVMLGCAAESLTLEIRDALLLRAKALSITTPKALDDWKIKTVLDGLFGFLNARSAMMPKSLRDDFQAFWPALTHQIRVVRNDAGHPTSVAPVSADAVHGSYLLFPDLARITSQLVAWISTDLK